MKREFAFDDFTVAAEAYVQASNEGARVTERESLFSKLLYCPDPDAVLQKVSAATGEDTVGLSEMFEAFKRNTMEHRKNAPVPKAGPPPKPKAEPEQQAEQKQIEPPTIKSMTGLELMATDFPEPRWVVPQILPEGLAMLVGTAKIGKSILSLNIGLSVAAGKSILNDSPIEQGQAVYFCLEGGPAALKRRLGEQLIGLKIEPTDPNLKNLILYNEFPRCGDGSFDLNILANMAANNKDIKTVIIDTWGLTAPPVRKGENAYQYALRALTPFAKLAVEYHISLIAVHHSKKGFSQDPIDQISGSIGIGACADTVLSIKRHVRGAASGLLSITGRQMEETELAVSLDYPFWHILGDAAAFKLSKERQDVLETIKDFNSPVSPSQIAKALEKSRQAVNNILVKLAADGFIIQTMYGRYALREEPFNGL